MIQLQNSNALKNQVLGIYQMVNMKEQ
jgi:hypothetical protein